MICKLCGDPSAHLFHQGLGNRQPQTNGIPGGFHGEEPVKQLSNLNLVESSGGVGKHNRTILTEGNFQIAVAVFEGVGICCQLGLEGSPISKAALCIR